MQQRPAAEAHKGTAKPAHIIQTRGPTWAEKIACPSIASRRPHILFASFMASGAPKALPQPSLDHNQAVTFLYVSAQVIITRFFQSHNRRLTSLPRIGYCTDHRVGKTFKQKMLLMLLMMLLLLLLWSLLLFVVVCCRRCCCCY